MNVRLKIFFSFLVAVACLFPLAKAYAVFVSPIVVTIAPNQNAATISLNNRSNKTKVLNFSWQRRMLGPDGEPIILAEDDPLPENYRPADPYVKFSPRRVILRPREHQTVRLIVQRPVDMEPGEYRSHFLIDEEDLVEKKAGADGKGADLSGDVSVILSKSMPVLLRHGETKVDVKLNSAWIEDGKVGPRLNVSISNESTRSLYANLFLTCPGEELGADSKVFPLRIYKELKVIEKGYGLAGVFEPSCDDVTVSIMTVYDPETNGQVLDQKVVTMR